MSDQEAFERILALLYDAMLDDCHWPATSALIDEACGITSNGLMVSEGPKDDIWASALGFYARGQRREDLEREYLEVYHPIDERVPRVRQLPDSRLMHVKDLYTAQELKTSPTYNEMLLLNHHQDSLNVRLDGPDSSNITWGLGDPVASSGWGSSALTMVQRLLPHIRQFVRVRQALVSAEAKNTTLTALLDNPQIGIIHLDRRGRILAVNDRACGLLRSDGRLSDKDGVLCARGRDNQLQLKRLVADALPDSGTVAVSGSMLLNGLSGLPPYVVHVKPAGIPQSDFGMRSIAALVLIVDTAYKPRIDTALVAAALDLTPTESSVAVMLATGSSVREIAAAMRRRDSTIRWHLKQLFAKHRLSRQADLVRLMLSVSSVPLSRR